MESVTDVEYSGSESEFDVGDIVTIESSLHNFENNFEIVQICKDRETAYLVDVEKGGMVTAGFSFIEHV